MSTVRYRKGGGGDGPRISFAFFLAGALVARFPECALAALDPREGGLAHRLDRGTSGVMFFPKHKRAATHISYLLKTGGVEKVYWAVVQGTAEGGILGQHDFEPVVERPRG